MGRGRDAAAAAPFAEGARPVQRRGVVYDSGTVLSGLLWHVDSRPRLDLAVAHRELQIIRDDLHCNAVRVTGSHLDRLAAVAEIGLGLGLEVWYSPTIWERPAEQTLQALLSAAAAAETLRRRHPDRVTFILGTELTLFMRGIVPGRSIEERFGTPTARERLKAGTHNGPLNAFLGRAAAAARAVFGGPLTHASLAFEAVDWAPFDIVGIDHYRDARIKDRYVQMLQPLLATGKPVAVTEFGMRTYRGADSSGALGFGVLEQRTVVLHHLRLIGRLFRVRLKGAYIRDEGLQARELVETLRILDGAGIDGAFVSSFVDGWSSKYSEDPLYDLDMSGMGLVKTFARGHGTTYPDMPWEPKEAFRAVAAHYGGEEGSGAEPGGTPEAGAGPRAGQGG